MGGNEVTALLDEIQCDHAYEHPYCTDCPLTRTAAALRAVLDLHVPLNDLGSPPCAHCLADDADGEVLMVPWPCLTVQAVTTALSAVTRW